MVMVVMMAMMTPVVMMMTPVMVMMAPMVMMVMMSHDHRRRLRGVVREGRRHGDTHRQRHGGENKLLHSGEFPIILNIEDRDDIAGMKMNPA